MAGEIFISYSSKHRDLTRALAAVLEAQYGAGSVWWDYALESWGDYELQIRNALNAARIVVVIWTKAAGQSDWVKSEAGRANRDSKLINICPLDTAWRDVPSPFDQHHVNSLDDTAGILRSVAAVWNGTPIRTAVPEYEHYFLVHKRRLIDPKQQKLPRDPREISPTDLLQAKYEVVPYVDVTGLKAGLIDWCVGGHRATAGKLVHGAGGLGKTRLMIEVASDLRKSGWIAGFLDRPHEQVAGTLQQRKRALDQLIDHGDEAGLLIVMDYAEARQDEVKALCEHLARRPDSDSRRIRLVLLTRSAGSWWTELHDETAEIQSIFRRDANSPDVMELPSLATGAERRRLLLASVEAFAPTLAEQGYSRPSGDPEQDCVTTIEAGAGYARPLAVQIAALLWLTSHAPEAGAMQVDELLRRILGLERSHWQKLLGPLNETRMRDMVRGVAQVTLVQGTNSREASQHLLMADPFYAGRRTAPADVDPVVRDLARVYVRPDGGLAHLEPDLIGEHHVASVADNEMVDGCIAWIGGAPVDVQPKHRRDLLTVLQRATYAEHGPRAERAKGLLDHLIGTHLVTVASEMMAVVVDTPGALLDRLRLRIEALDADSLAALDAALPMQSLVLMDISLDVARRLAELARKMSDDIVPPNSAIPQGRNAIVERIAVLMKSALRFLRRKASEPPPDGSLKPQEVLLSERAGRVGTLGIRLSNLGRREEALAASQEAVDIYRRLGQTRPDAFLPDLASSLNNLGIRLSNLGRREEALAASQEAADIYQRLGQTRPDVFLPDLASSLNNSGAMLSKLGRHEEALAAGQEAVEIRRRLAQTRPDAFLPDLAMSLNNSGAMLSNLGRREEALAASQEAVDIYRRLAQTRPDAFLPDLAMSLNNLGIRLSNLGRREEALAASQEAVDIRRRLAQTRPDVFLPDLASSLNNSGAMLSNLGRREEALAASQEAVDIYRRLTQTRPDAFLPDLATSLNNLGIRLAHLGRREEALAASQEAVDIRRRLAQARPDAFLPDLAGSLNNLGGHLSNLGRREEALVASQEAVDIYQRLAQTRPDAFLPNLATSVSLMSDAFAALGRFGEAAEAASQALRMLAPFVVRYAEAYGSLARTIAGDVRRYSEKAGVEPDMMLLESVAHAFGAGGSTEENAEIEALKARIGAILEGAENTGTLDEAALAALPAEIAEQLRTAWANRPSPAHS
jgi:tetratricopeptide (TPR) repeat protein